MFIYIVKYCCKHSKHKPHPSIKALTPFPLVFAATVYLPQLQLVTALSFGFLLIKNSLFFLALCIIYTPYLISVLQVCWFLFCYPLHFLLLQCWEEHPFIPSDTNIKPFVAINGPVSFDASVPELLIPTACWQWTQQNIKIKHRDRVRIWTLC